MIVFLSWSRPSAVTLRRISGESLASERSLCTNATFFCLCFELFCVSLFRYPVLRAQEPKESAPQEMLNLFPGGSGSARGVAWASRMLRGRQREVDSHRHPHRRAGRPHDLRVTLELPALVRVEGLRSDGSALIYDGKTGVYPNSRLEEALLEIFSSDTTEGMLASVRQGAAIQLLGRRVGSVTRQEEQRDLKAFRRL